MPDAGVRCLLEHIHWSPLGRVVKGSQGHGKRQAASMQQVVCPNRQLEAEEKAWTARLPPNSKYPSTLSAFPRLSRQPCLNFISFHGLVTTVARMVSPFLPFVLTFILFPLPLQDAKDLSWYAELSKVVTLSFHGVPQLHLGCAEVRQLDLKATINVCMMVMKSLGDYSGIILKW